MTKTVEELEARVGELEREVERLRSATIMPVTGTIAVGHRGGTSHTVLGAEEMVLQIGPDDAVGYVNAPMAKLLGIPDRRHVLGMPFPPFDHGPIGDGVITALVQMGRRSDDLHILERACPDLPLDRLPAAKGARPSTDPVLRFTAAGTQGRVQITAQDVTLLKWLETTFSRYVSPAVIEKMHQLPSEHLLQMERRTLSVLFVDMRGFTRLSQNLEPEGVGELVNSFLASMVACIEALDGTIDKYVGDNVMAFFGAPVAHEDHAVRALVCAAEMQRRNREWVAARAAENKPAGMCGVGVATGPVVAGNIGTATRMDYTALGHTTNIAARLCGTAGPGEILILESTYKAAAEQRKLYKGSVPMPHLGFSSKGKLQFKNVDEPIEVISVTEKA